STVAYMTPFSKPSGKLTFSPPAFTCNATVRAPQAADTANASAVFLAFMAASSVAEFRRWNRHATNRLRHVPIPWDTLPRESGLLVDLGALLHELDRLLLHALFQRVLLGQTLLLGVFAHVLGDLH